MTRFEEYRAALSAAMCVADLDQLDLLLQKIRSDSIGYIEKTEGNVLPTFEFTFCYNRSDYEALSARHGADARNTYGISIGTVRGRNLIFIDLETPLKLLRSENPNRNFIVNVTLVIFEELLHVLYPQLSETDIDVRTNQLVESFLGIRIEM